MRFQLTIIPPKKTQKLSIGVDVNSEYEIHQVDPRGIFFFNFGNEQ